MTASRRSCEDTRVPVDRSRGEIGKILAKWGALGVQWEDDFSTGTATLRFRWAPGGGHQVVARLQLRVNVSSLQTHRNIDAIREQERRRLHRVALHWIRAQHAAVEAGLFKAETVILPWLEDVSGRTLGEILTPALADLGRSDLGRRMLLGGAP